MIGCILQSPKKPLQPNIVTEGSANATALAPDCPVSLHSSELDKDFVLHHQLVGTLRVTETDDEPQRSERLVAALRPEVCALGGELLVPVEKDSKASAGYTYIVFRKVPERKPAVKPSLSRSLTKP
jgi:hypothetical protein